MPAPVYDFVHAEYNCLAYDTAKLVKCQSVANHFDDVGWVVGHVHALKCRGTNWCMFELEKNATLDGHPNLIRAKKGKPVKPYVELSARLDEESYGKLWWFVEYDIARFINANGDSSDNDSGSGSPPPVKAVSAPKQPRPPSSPSKHSMHTRHA